MHDVIWKIRKMLYMPSFLKLSASQEHYEALFCSVFIPFIALNDVGYAYGAIKTGVKRGAAETQHHNFYGR